MPSSSAEGISIENRKRFLPGDIGNVAQELCGEKNNDVGDDQRKKGRIVEIVEATVKMPHSERRFEVILYVRRVPMEPTSQ